MPLRVSDLILCIMVNLACGLMLPLPCHAQDTYSKKKIKLPTALNEVSGVQWINRDRVLWINDSGGGASVWTTNDQGKLESKIDLPIINVDWEELTSDLSGNLFIGDFGNNNFQRAEMKIYKLNASLDLLDSIQYTYGDEMDFFDQKKINLDVEAMVWKDGNLHLFSKDKMDHKKTFFYHYILQDHGKKQIAKLAGRYQLPGYVISGAAIDPSRTQLALLMYQYRTVFGKIIASDAKILLIKNWTECFQDMDQIEVVSIPFWIQAAQYESIDFVNDHTLIVGAEKTWFMDPFFRILKINHRS